MFDVCISQRVKFCFNVKSSTYYFHIKTDILVDFQILIGVPVIEQFFVSISLKGALSGLRQFLATKSPFKMMKNRFVLKIFKFQN